MANEKKDITVFAETNFRNMRRKFGIKPDDRRRHMYVVGKTGMGKSTLLENMIIDDIRKGRGVAVVDPHGDLAEQILAFIPKTRINDVIYFNPADTQYPVAFNILESVGDDYKHLVAYGLVGVFKKIWADSWGPRMEYILTNTILVLLDYPGSTLLGVMRVLVDKSYRKKVVAKVTDPVVKTFWADEFSNYSEKFRTEAIAPIQNKVGQFLSSSIIRNIVGQSKSTIEMRQIMDEQKILIMNLSKGRVGEENSALLGAMMITKLQIAAMSRVDIPEKDRIDFYLYVDEFQNFATDSFAGILSEARKYRLNLIMAHQYIEQLGDEVKYAVFGNVGTMLIFRIGANDALEIEPEFGPQFVAQDIVNLNKYNFIIRLMIDGIATEPFSAIGLPPVSSEEASSADKVIKVSRERYARPQEIVEDRIIRWSGVEIIKKPVEEKKDSEPDADDQDQDEMDDDLSSFVDQTTERPLETEQDESVFDAPVNTAGMIPDLPTAEEIASSSIATSQNNGSEIITESVEMEQPQGVNIGSPDTPLFAPANFIPGEDEFIPATIPDEPKEVIQEVSIKKAEVQIVPDAMKVEDKPVQEVVVDLEEDVDGVLSDKKKINFIQTDLSDKDESAVDSNKPVVSLFDLRHGNAPTVNFSGGSVKDSKAKNRDNKQDEQKNRDTTEQSKSGQDKRVDNTVHKEETERKNDRQKEVREDIKINNQEKPNQQSNVASQDQRNGSESSSVEQLQPKKKRKRNRKRNRNRESESIQEPRQQNNRDQKSSEDPKPINQSQQQAGDRQPSQSQHSQGSQLVPENKQEKKHEDNQSDKSSDDGDATTKISLDDFI
ncbi:MAG: type IV secretion system DNA-binding domain-containing protein [bacterium]|nr:type IV secretion system DNA-binding domain-containing protein [bacterium]